MAVRPRLRFFHYLNIVVNKADYTKRYRQQDGAPVPGDLHLCAMPEVIFPLAQHEASHHRRDENGKNEHEAAHGGSALLILVPAGADVQNGLSKVQLVQIGNQKISADCRHRKANGCHSQYCCCIHRRNSPVILVLSWLQGLFRIGKDSPQYLLQIHEQTALEPDNIPGTDCFPHRLGQSRTVGVFPGASERPAALAPST